MCMFITHMQKQAGCGVCVCVTQELWFRLLPSNTAHTGRNQNNVQHATMQPLSYAMRSMQAKRRATCSHAIFQLCKVQHAGKNNVQHAAVQPFSYAMCNMQAKQSAPQDIQGLTVLGKNERDSAPQDAYGPHLGQVGSGNNKL